MLPPLDILYFVPVMHHTDVMSLGIHFVYHSSSCTIRVNCEICGILHRTFRFCLYFPYLITAEISHFHCLMGYWDWYPYFCGFDHYISVDVFSNLSSLSNILKLITFFISCFFRTGILIFVIFINVSQPMCSPAFLVVSDVLRWTLHLPNPSDLTRSPTVRSNEPAQCLDRWPLGK